jgi:hypothetical protein
MLALQNIPFCPDGKPITLRFLASRTAAVRVTTQLVYVAERASLEGRFTAFREALPFWHVR